MRAKATSVDDYLAGVSTGQRAALERLRRTIRSIAPTAEETINYGIPTFRLDGHDLVGFGASSRHCALYTLSGSIVAELADALSGFDTSKGTIRFQPDRPLPDTLVRKVVKARIAENARRGKPGKERR
ncbi:MAG: hypothetical protein EHM78_05720 [Myxococcaceae bacterium]|nr:MAG: hypothetical protein EHM78_05720 [Myxococcaceae bacterium]